MLSTFANSRYLRADGNKLDDVTDQYRGEKTRQDDNDGVGTAEATANDHGKFCLSG